MLMFNPTEDKLYFIYGGQEYQFQPKEIKELPEHLVVHAVERWHLPIIEHKQMYDKEVKVSNIPYAQLPWKKLVQIASARGVYKMGYTRDMILKLLDESQGRTL